MNMHNRLSIQPLVIEYYRPVFAIYQHLYTLSVEVCFTRIGDFTWRVSDCEELSGGFYLEGV